MAQHGGVEGLADLLKVDLKKGLEGNDFNERAEQFDNNYRKPMKAKMWIALFWQALDDLMLKVLIVAAVVSLVLDMSLAEPHHRSHAWIEGAAIMVAVMLVAGVGSFVDWRKEL